MTVPRADAVCAERVSSCHDLAFNRDFAPSLTGGASSTSGAISAARDAKPLAHASILANSDSHVGQSEIPSHLSSLLRRIVSCDDESSQCPRCSRPSMAAGSVFRRLANCETIQASTVFASGLCINFSLIVFGSGVTTGRWGKSAKLRRR